MNVFLIVGATIGVATLAVIMRAWVLTILWGWFIVPMGAGALSIGAAIGISVIVGMFTQHLQQDKAEEVKTVGGLVSHVVSRAFLAPLVSLLIGWIATSFM